ncbi:hypothetical protein ACFV4G_17650 [Kitasatospora sp. NPDC059747]|uniref:hypothetical protein n=1 Tax=Kitasatospora sp. NPDC059747 TaxID=3346930 RepID=UPI0036669DB4
MGKQEMRRTVDAPLRRAGLEVLEGGVPQPVLPVSVVGFALHRDPGPQDLGLVYVDRDEPDLVARANQGWYELALSCGLFGADREFLLALPVHRFSARAASRHRRKQWRRVRLLERWDLMGAGCSVTVGTHELGHPQRLLGFGPGLPGFAMLSLDGSVTVLGTTEQSGIAFHAVSDPGKTESVRGRLQAAANRAWDPREEWSMGAVRAEREEARAWLLRQQG